MSVRSAQFRAHSHLHAANIGYFLCGIAVACWAPLIPVIKESLNIDNYEVGILVFCFGIGSILGMSFSGILANRFGFQKIYVASATFTTLTLIFVSTIPNFYIIFPLVLILGFFIGFLEVLINIYGAALEKHYKIFFLSPLFAFYSMGEVIGAALMLSLFSLNVNPVLSITPIILGVYLITMSYGKKVLNLDISSNHKKQSFMWPKGSILPISIIVCSTFIVGGATIDWSAIFIKNELGIESKYTIFGYLLVSTCMLFCRLFSKKIVKKIGQYNTVKYGAFFMLIGIALLLSIADLRVYILSFILIGIGMSNISPQSMSAVAKQQDMPVVAAIATISSIGYMGLMFAPAFLGIIAGYFGSYAVYIALFLITLLNITMIISIKKVYLKT